MASNQLVYNGADGILRLLLRRYHSGMTTIKEESTSNVRKVHFYVKDNILMDLSESKLSL